VNSDVPYYSDAFCSPPTSWLR